MNVPKANMMGGRIYLHILERVLRALEAKLFPSALSLPVPPCDAATGKAADDVGGIACSSI